ncbi:hypothetical protein R3P38DRAFT_3235267 [Favolaschia claudopus]|uniref:Uncharacterized protein n=1 Tax=Favolaschia claudopus TaxID=2862362 RepID=A0AAV9ZEA7_9AGAR
MSRHSRQTSLPLLPHHRLRRLTRTTYRLAPRHHFAASGVSKDTLWPRKAEAMRGLWLERGKDSVEFSREKHDARAAAGVIAHKAGCHRPRRQNFIHAHRSPHTPIPALARSPPPTTYAQNKLKLAAHVSCFLHLTLPELSSRPQLLLFFQHTSYHDALTTPPSSPPTPTDDVHTWLAPEAKIRRKRKRGLPRHPVRTIMASHQRYRRPDPARAKDN